MSGLLLILCIFSILSFIMLGILLLRSIRKGSEGGRELDTLKDDIRYMTDMITEIEHAAAEAQDRRLADMQRQFSNMQIQNEQKLDSIRQTVDKRIAGLETENSKRLEQMQKTVDEKLQETLESRITKSFKLVSERLEEVYKGLGEMKKLAGGVDDLSKVLSNVKTRGMLGEIQLGAILSQILSPEQYEENVATRPGASERVEYAVKLPGNGGGCVWLPIDAKFPGDTYSALVDAYDSGDQEEIARCGKNLENVIRKSAKDIHEKYVEPPATTDFAIMFLPTEGLYAEVVRRGMLQRLQNEFRINVAGPSNMAALLNSIQMGFKTIAIRKQSGHVWEVLAQVKNEFGKFEEVLRSAQNRIDQANKDLDKLVGVRTRSINRSLRDLQEPEKAFSEEGGEEDI